MTFYYIIIIIIIILLFLYYYLFLLFLLFIINIYYVMLCCCCSLVNTRTRPTTSSFRPPSPPMVWLSHFFVNILDDRYTELLRWQPRQNVSASEIYNKATGILGMRNAPTREEGYHPHCVLERELDQGMHSSS